MSAAEGGAIAGEPPMARPGPEPGTPRFSEGGIGYVSAQETLQIAQIQPNDSPIEIVRNMRGSGRRLGPEIAFVARRGMFGS